MLSKKIATAAYLSPHISVLVTSVCDLSVLSAGMYSGAAASACSECLAGSYCNDPTLAPQACDPGDYSLGGLVSII